MDSKVVKAAFVLLIIFLSALLLSPLFWEVYTGGNCAHEGKDNVEQVAQTNLEAGEYDNIEEARVKVRRQKDCFTIFVFFCGIPALLGFVAKTLVD